MRISTLLVGALVAGLGASSVAAQQANTLPPVPLTFPTDDPVIKRIWSVGMDSSKTEELAQVLLDSIGPRLTGSPGMRSASDWVIARYKEWGIDARREEYGT